MSEIRRRTFGVWLPVWGVLLLGLAPRAAAGEPGSATAARRHYDRGQKLYAAGRYRDAGAEFARACDLEPLPKYLYNAAQTLRLAGDCRAAIRLYETFLRVAPDADSSVAAARNLERCRASSGSPPPGPTPPQLTSTPTLLASAPIPDAATLTSFSATELTSDATPQRKRLRWEAGVGGALFGATLLTASVLQGLGSTGFNDLNGTCAPNCTAVQVAPVQRERDAATALFITGGLVAAATLVALVITHLDEARSFR